MHSRQGVHLFNLETQRSTGLSNNAMDCGFLTTLNDKHNKRSKAVKSKLQKKLLGLLFVSAAMGTSVQAEVLYQFNATGYQTYSWSPQASIHLYVDGSGVNQTVYLFAFSGVRGVDYKYWGGIVPNDALQIQGISGIKVNVDTCEILNNDGCGLIDVTIDSEPGWENFRTSTGVTQYKYNDIIMTSVGHTHDRYTTTTGTINGYPIDIQAPNWNSTISKTSEMSVRVETGN
jgi:hypothetical protein